jgi:hypothetical protein
MATSQNSSCCDTCCFDCKCCDSSESSTTTTKNNFFRSDNSILNFVCYGEPQINTIQNSVCCLNIYGPPRLVQYTRDTWSSPLLNCNNCFVILFCGYCIKSQQYNHVHYHYRKANASCCLSIMITDLMTFPCCFGSVVSTFITRLMIAQKYAIDVHLCNILIESICCCQFCLLNQHEFELDTNVFLK